MNNYEATPTPEVILPDLNMGELVADSLNEGLRNTFHIILDTFLQPPILTIVIIIIGLMIATFFLEKRKKEREERKKFERQKMFEKEWEEKERKPL